MKEIKKITCIGADDVGPTMSVIAQKNPNVEVTVVDLGRSACCRCSDQIG